MQISRSAKTFLGPQIEADKISTVRILAGATKLTRLVRGGHALVNLSEPHANPHGVLHELLGATVDT